MCSSRQTRESYGPWLDRNCRDTVKLVSVNMLSSIAVMLVPAASLIPSSNGTSLVKLMCVCVCVRQHHSVRLQTLGMDMNDRLCSPMASINLAASNATTVTLRIVVTNDGTLETHCFITIKIRFIMGLAMLLSLAMGWRWQWRS